MTFQTHDRSRAIRRRGALAPHALAIAILGLSLASVDPAAAQHGVCSVGSALSSAYCVSQICEVDPFCCSTAWDNICISEVKTVCGSDECAPGAIVIDAFDGGFMGTVGGVDMVKGPSIIVTENTHSVPPPSDIRRQWHKFDLSGVTRSIASAQLQFHFPTGAYGSTSSWVALTVWDVTSPPNSFGWDPAIGGYRPYSSTVFADLGSGTSYGSRYYTAADEGTLTVIPFNASGVAGVNASRGGVFAVGGAGPYYACSSPCSPVPPMYIFQLTGTVEGNPTLGSLPTLRRMVLVPPECSNGVDDDLDGLTDHPTDTGCLNGTDLSERDPARACDDGADNDGDSKSDYYAAGGGDPGCYNAQSALENPQCQDGLDNDHATGIDFDGGASLDLDPPDGFIDATFNPGTPAVRDPDPQCLSKPWRTGESSTCGLGAELVLLLPLLALRSGRA